MKRLPYLILLVLVVAYTFYILQTRTQLPDRVATHFDALGVANGWMTRDVLISSALKMGLGLPLVMAGVFSLLRIVPTRFINIPHREYWLSPENSTATVDWIARGGIWIACLLVAFMGFVHHAVVTANRLPQPKFDNAPVLLVACVFVGCVLFFIIRMLVRFSKPPLQAS